VISEGKVDLLIIGGYVLSVDDEVALVVHGETLMNGVEMLGVDGQEVVGTARTVTYSAITMRANTR
jgi:hypothetical protein